MTHPKEAVEAMARALVDANNDGLRGDMWVRQCEITARALLDQIAPMLTVQAEADKAAAVDAERAACTDEMRLALAAAVAGERERCAMIAKTFDTVLVDTSGGTWKIQPTFDAVAAAIREAPQ